MKAETEPSEELCSIFEGTNSAYFDEQKACILGAYTCSDYRITTVVLITE